MRNRAASSTVLFRFAVPLAIAASLGCGPAGSGAASPANERKLPPYSGHATELFDDAIEARAVGLELEQTSTPRSDPRTRERSQVADVVVRARVDTVTGKVEGPETSYQVGFKVIDTLTGKHPVGETFAIRLDKNSPSIGILRSFEGRLVGKTMVVFVRAFVRADAEQELHVHVAPDAKDVLDAVHDAMVLEDFGSMAPPPPPSK
jgi:hypothetical protein